MTDWPAEDPGTMEFVPASTDGTVRVWEMATGNPITLPLRVRAPVRYASFLPGHEILTVTGSTVQRWKLHPNDEPTDVWLRRAQMLSGTTLNDRSLEVTLDRAKIRQLWEEK